MKTMKLAALLLGVVLLLCACKRSEMAGGLGGALDEWRAAGEAPEPVEPSEIVTYADGRFADTLGFNLEYPDSEALRPMKFFAIDGWFAQVEFLDPDDETRLVRVAGAKPRLLAPTFLEDHASNMSTLTIDGLEVSVRYSAGDCMLVLWTRDDYQYAAHSSEHTKHMSEAEIEELVMGLRAVPAA